MRPFEGLTVLDLTHVLAGPFCAYQLALLGAETIKIEPPTEPDCVRGRGPDDALNAALMGINFLTQGANKRALTLDLKQEKGREILRRLAVSADVLIENYRSAALAALGLGYDAMAALNPRLVYCSMTGYGQLGDRAGVNAYDNVIQAASGLMARTGTHETGPLKTGASIIDYATGLNAAFAIASALFQRTRTGRGQRIDVAMLDTALLLMGPELVAALHGGAKTKRPAEAGLGCYRTKDGLLMLGAFNVRQNRRMWQALGRRDFAALEDWTALWGHADAMRAALEPVLATRSAAEWEAQFHAIGVPAERVRSLEEAAAMPQLGPRGFLHELPEILPDAPPVRVPVAGFTFAQDGPAITAPPPRFGEHSDAILGELGYDGAAIAALRRDGVV